MDEWLGAVLPSLVLLHVGAAFAFVLVHGPSVFALWGLRTETDPARLGALLDLSGRANAASWVAFVAMGGSGLLLAGTQHTWRLPWVWGSIVLLVLVTLLMSLLGSRPFNHARGALGLRWFDGKRTQPATGHVDPAALEEAMRMVRARAPALVTIGLLGLAGLVFLMIARPG